jgi:5-methylcytosine-specific restriction protein A
MKPPLACPRCGCAQPCECLYGKERQETKKHIDRERYYKNRAGHRLYGLARWYRDTQPAVLRRDPVCKHCNRYGSTVADHIVDHRGDEKLFWNMANLQGLCKECHDIKTFGSMAERRANYKANINKPGIVDGKVVDHAPKATARPIGSNPTFDYRAAMNKGKPPTPTQ